MYLKPFRGVFLKMLYKVTFYNAIIEPSGYCTNALQDSLLHEQRKPLGHVLRCLELDKYYLFLYIYIYCLFLF